MKRELTVFQRLVRAAKRGTGIRLSEDDVFLLGGMFDHIRHIAAMDDEEDERNGKEPQPPASGEGVKI